MAAITFDNRPGARASRRPSRPQPAPGRLLTVRQPSRRQPSAPVRRRRAAAAIVAIAAVGALLGVGSLAGAGQAAADRDLGSGSARAVPVVAVSHVVQPGDTLWTLARRLQPDGDVRPLVARLRGQRGPGPLVPGERIRLTV